MACPSNSTLNALKPKADFEVGIKEDLIREFRDAIGLLSATTLVCVSHDEVSVKSGMNFDASYGYVTGLAGKGPIKFADSANYESFEEELKKIEEKDLAKHALIYMASSLDGKVCRVIGWEFTRSYDYNLIVTRALEIDQKLHAVGLQMLVFSSDSPANNLKAMLELDVMREAGKVTFFALPDYTHLDKNEIHDLRLGANHQFRDKDNNVISLNVLWRKKLQGGFANLSETLDLFPRDLQKVSPMLRVLGAAKELREKHSANAEAMVLATFLEHVQSFHDAMDVKRISIAQPNPSQRPVLTLSQRLTKVAEAGAYFASVRTCAHVFWEHGKSGRMR